MFQQQASYKAIQLHHFKTDLELHGTQFIQVFLNYKTALKAFSRSLYHLLQLCHNDTLTLAMQERRDTYACTETHLHLFENRSHLPLHGKLVRGGETISLLQKLL